MSLQNRVKQLLIENDDPTPGTYFGNGLSEWQKCVKKHGVKEAQKYYNKVTKKCYKKTLVEYQQPTHGASWKELVKRYGVKEAKRVRDSMQQSQNLALALNEDDETPVEELESQTLDEEEFNMLAQILSKLRESTKQPKLKMDIDAVLMTMHGGSLDLKLVNKLVKRKGFKKQYMALVKKLEKEKAKRISKKSGGCCEACSRMY
jgi:hypothetical protein